MRGAEFGGNNGRLNEGGAAMFRNAASGCAKLLLAGAAICWIAGPVQAQHGGGGHGGGGHGGGGHAGGGGGHAGGGYHGGGYGGAYHGGAYAGAAYHGSGYHSGGYYGGGYHAGGYHGGYGGYYPYGYYNHHPYRRAYFAYGYPFYYPFYGSYPFAGSYGYYYPDYSLYPPPDIAYDPGYAGAVAPGMFGDSAADEPPSTAPDYYRGLRAPRRIGAASAEPIAHIVLRVPANALVWFDGSETTSTGPVREFESPPLASGRQYTYQIKARWVENGQTITRTQDITVSAGAQLEVDFPSSAQQ
jgi:uncharacterized protein (TIGR03000 family)